MKIKDNANRNEVLEDIDELLMGVVHSSHVLMAKEAIEMNQTHRAIMYLMMAINTFNKEDRFDLLTEISVIVNKLDEGM